MYMVMVVIAGCSCLARLIATNLRIIQNELILNMSSVGMLIVMLVIVMPEMGSMDSSLLQRAANARRSHIRDIQCKHDGEQYGEIGAHGG